MHPCSQCGAEVRDGSRFCASCGAAQTDLSVTSTIPVALPPVEDSAAPTQPHSDLPRGVTALVVDRGADAGTRFLLTSTAGAVVTIGRDSDSDIFLDDVTVSRRHATARLVEGQWLLSDTGSLNGTYVNGSRSAGQVLHAGDIVNIGKFRFVVVAGQS